MPELDLAAIEARYQRRRFTEPHAPSSRVEVNEISQLIDEDLPALVDEVRQARDRIQSLTTEIEQCKRGGQEIGKIVVVLNELIRDVFVKGADDPVGALHMLGDYLAELLEGEGGLPADEFNRVYRAIEARRQSGEAVTP